MPETKCTLALKKGSKKAMTKTREDGKKRMRSRKARYSVYIYKVLKQVHPNTGISSKVIGIMNSLVIDIFERIGRGVAPGALQALDHHFPGNPEGLAPAAARGVGQARCVQGHRGRHQVYQLQIIAKNKRFSYITPKSLLRGIHFFQHKNCNHLYLIGLVEQVLFTLLKLKVAALGC